MTDTTPSDGSSFEGPIRDADVITVTAGSGPPPCDVCRNTGLAVLPVRYTVIPADCPGADLGPFSAEQVKSIDLGDSGLRYATRTLRGGFLYLFFERSVFGKNYWEAYSVAENGTLWKQASAASARSLGSGLPSCSRDGHIATRMQYFVITEPHLCGKVWMAFSDHKWTPATLDRYKQDKKLRQARMQPIDPAGWLGAPSDGQHAAAVSSPATLKHALEYRSFDHVAGEFPELRHFGKPLTFSRSDGGFNAGLLHACSTRYAWSLRNQKTADGLARVDDAITDLHARMCLSSPKREDPKKQYTPMMVALWDAVGITHELNGYRSDAAGKLLQYEQERQLEVDAVKGIRSILTLMHNRAPVLVKDYTRRSRNEAQRQTREGDQWVTGKLDAREKPLMREHRSLLNRYESGQIDFGQYQTQRSALIDKHANPLHGAVGDYTPYDADRSAEIERLFGTHDAVRRYISESSWRNLSSAMIAAEQQDAQKQWEEDYWPLIDEARFTAFEKKYQQLQDAVDRLVARRSTALGKWIEHDAFHIALEDYDENEPNDGPAFVATITRAIEGLDSEPVGQAILDRLTIKANTKRDSLLWRAVAYNHKPLKDALDATLAQAQSHQRTPMDAAAAGWAALTEATEQLKTHSAVYQQMEMLQHNTRPLNEAERLLRDAHVDSFVVNAGNSLFRWLRLDDAGDYVGEKIIQSVLLVRAGVNARDMRLLVQQQARLDASLRKLLLTRWALYRSQGIEHGAFALALDDLAAHRGSHIMQQEWQKVSASVRFPTRLAAVVGCLELVNFIKIASGADKEAKDYALLAASGLSLAGAVATIAILPLEKLFTSASQTTAAWKAAGAAFGGAAGFIGAVVDATDLRANLQRGNYSLAALYFVKAFLGLAGSAAFTITAMSSSASVMKRALGAGRVVLWLEAMSSGVAAATDARTALAAGKTVATLAGRAAVMRGMGTAVLILTGWEVALALSAIQVLVWVFSPNELEEWCGNNAFGNEPKYRTAQEQGKAFHAALADVGLNPENR